MIASGPTAIVITVAGIGELVEPFAHQWLNQLEQGRCSSVEIVQHYLDKIKSLEGGLNAVVSIDEEQLLRSASEADRQRRDGRIGKLLGLPISVKDNIETTDLPCSSGLYARRDHRPLFDAAAVQRVRNAGGLILCKTNLPEFAASYQTDNGTFGKTNNPHDLTRTAGGSSGGEAALIGAACSPLGLGTDGGGSIRVPAHYCGIFGLRPTAGRVPETGVWPSSRASGYSDMVCLGPMARSTTDIALLLDVIAGPDGVDPYAPPVPLGHWQRIDVRNLKVAYYEEDELAPPTDHVREGVKRAARALLDVGVAVIKVDGPPCPTRATELFHSAICAGGRRELLNALEGSEHTLSQSFRMYLETVPLDGMPARDYFRVLAEIHQFRSQVRSWVSRFDAVISPVCSGAAPLHGHLPGANLPLDAGQPQCFNYTHVYSVAGLPAMSVPTYPAEGLPTGVQVVAPYWREDLVLAVSHALERAFAPRPS